MQGRQYYLRPREWGVVKGMRHAILPSMGEARMFVFVETGFLCVALAIPELTL